MEEKVETEEREAHKREREEEGRILRLAEEPARIEEHGEKAEANDKDNATFLERKKIKANAKANSDEEGAQEFLRQKTTDDERTARSALVMVSKCAFTGRKKYRRLLGICF